MVLWEVTLATAYFLGLKKTYKLALRLQKRLIGPNHPKAREFVHRRIRSVFDMAVRVHQNIQQRDIEVGRNVGNWVLRWLNRMKPSAEIRIPPEKLPTHSNTTKQITGTSQPAQRTNAKVVDRDSKGRLFFSPLNMRPKSLPAITMMMQPMRPANMNSQYRHLSHFSNAPALDYRISRLEGGVFRKDIALWMQHN